uniref:Polysaccharide biosynthesis protein n=1 Tax=Vibrio parahaemolyticus TaxID=670 RepID=A0A7M1W786_VIBPH|nr:hypothetical protein VP35_00017 [Vibrio parahaemolyticus]
MKFTNYFNKLKEIKNVLIYLLSNILVGVLPLALMPFYTKYLSPSEYGTIALFQMLYIVFRSLSGMSYVTATERNYFKKEFNNSRYCSASLQLTLISLFFILLILMLIGDSIAIFIGLNIDIINKSAIVGCCCVIVQLRLNQWQVRKYAYKYGALQVLLALLNNLIGLYLIVEMSQGVEGRVDSILYAYLIFSLFSLCSLYNDRVLIFKPNLKLNIERKSILNFALPLLPHVIGVFFITVFDRFILGLNLGLESVGFYMVAFQLMSALGMVSDAFNKFFSPVQMRLLEQGSEESLQKLAKYIYVWVAFILSSALISVVIFNFYIENFLSAQYIESKSILPWLAMGHCFNALYLVFINSIYFSNQNSTLSKSTVIVMLLHISIFYFMTKFYGIEGAGISFCVSMGLRLLFTFYISNKKVKLPWFIFTFERKL